MPYLTGGRQIHFLKQDFAELLRRIDVEGTPGELVNLPCDLLDTFGETRGQFRQNGGIDAYAGVLHPGQNGRERQVDVVIDAGQFLGGNLRAQDIDDRESSFGLLFGGGVQLAIEQTLGQGFGGSAAWIGAQQEGIEESVIGEISRRDCRGAAWRRGTP